MIFLNWFHYFYIPYKGPWYTASIWGNIFCGPVIVALAWIWSKTKFWPLRPLNKIYDHAVTTLVHAEHQSKLIEEMHHLAHTGELHPRVLDRMNNDGSGQTPSVENSLSKSATMQDVAVVNPSKEKNKQMPSASQIKQFLVTSILPLVVGAVVTWLSGTQVLSIFHISSSAAAGVLTQLGVFGIAALTTWLASHHVLKGTYVGTSK